jgi:hypothetical protein
MSRAAAVDRLGAPDRTAGNVDYWDEDGWELRAEYDPDGKVTNVVRTLALK